MQRTGRIGRLRFVRLLRRNHIGLSLHGVFRVVQRGCFGGFRRALDGDGLICGFLDLHDLNCAERRIRSISPADFGNLLGFFLHCVVGVRSSAPSSWRGL